MKQKIISIISIFIGLTLLVYPFISNYIFERSASSMIRNYETKQKTYTARQKEKALNDAKEYNENLNQSKVQLTDPFKVKKSDGEIIMYNRILDFDDSGIMGYLEIPCISINLPIYHGTSGDILEHGIGHLAASSIPVGGKSTHSVLTGHTGLSTARLFTDLTETKKGDLFFVHILSKTLAYKVDKIMVVKPEDTKMLQIIDGKDYVTLVTCTPYGVNDHRLLVRGIRTKFIKNTEKMIRHQRTSQWMMIYKRAILIGIFIILTIFLIGRTIKKVWWKYKED